MRLILGLGTLLLLLMPGVGGAHEAWGQQPRARLTLVPEAMAGGTPASDLSLALRSTNDSMEVAQEAPRPSVAARVGSEVLVGALLGVNSMFAGALGGLLLGTKSPARGCTGDSCLPFPSISGNYVGLGVVSAIALVAPVGVYVGGSWEGGEGRLLPTFAGSLAAGGVTAWAFALKGDLFPRGHPPLSDRALVSLMITPLVGSIIGYEASHFVLSRASRGAASGVQLVPTAGVTGTGAGVFGLAGRF